MLNSLCFLVLFPINYQMTLRLRSCGSAQGQNRTSGWKFLPMKATANRRPLRNSPDGSINMLARGTHEGEQFVARAFWLRAK